MKINKKRVLRRLEDRKSDRKATTVYLSDDLFKSFKRACKANGHSASEVIEEMIKEFLGQP